MYYVGLRKKIGKQGVDMSMRRQSDPKIMLISCVCSAYTPVYDAGPTLNQYWFTVLYMLGHIHSAM